MLIAAWETADNSHRLGLDLHLRLRQFAHQLPDDIEPAQLKTLITPLFAHDKEQQNNFYEIFDKSLTEFSENFPQELFEKNNSEENNSEENNSEENNSEKISENKIENIFSKKNIFHRNATAMR